VAANTAYAGAWGVGKTSCAEFAKLYRLNPDRTEEVFFNWAQGFISGLDLSSEAFNKNARLAVGSILAIEPTKLNIRAYCDKHPLMPYYMAVFDTYKNLPASPAE
jgi:hypothetical protein